MALPDTSGSTELPQDASRFPGTEATLDAAEALLRAESVASRTIFASESFAVVEGDVSLKREPSAAKAIEAATRLAQRGERASALIAPHELLDAQRAIAEAADARAPIVIHVVGAADGEGPGRSELAPALDLGAGVLVSWSLQDAVDLAVAARRAAEDSETPFVHVCDAPPSKDLSVLLPTRELIAHFLGAERRKGTINDADQAAPGSKTRAKRAERSFAARVPFALASAMRELGDRTGRALSPVERHETHEAEEIVVAIGRAFVAARAAAWVMREEGRKVGVLGVRALRPFYSAEAVKATSRGRAVVVIEPLDVALAPCGPVALALKAAFADALTWAPGFPGVGRIPPIVSVLFATLEGAIDEASVRAAVSEIGAGERAKRVLVLGSDG